EEDGFVFALKMDVETHGVTFTPADKGRHAYAMLDPGKDWVFGIRLLLVGKIHARIEPDIDAARNNPEIDVRRHQATVAEGDPAWLDRFEDELSRRHVARTARPAGKIRICLAACFGRAVVEAIGIGLPDLDQRILE